MAQDICKNRQNQTAVRVHPHISGERSTNKCRSVNAHVGMCENPSTGTKVHACIKTLTRTTGKYRASLNEIAPATLETASRYKGYKVYTFKSRKYQSSPNPEPLSMVSEQGCDQIVDWRGNQPPWSHYVHRSVW